MSKLLVVVLVTVVYGCVSSEVTAPAPLKVQRHERYSFSFFDDRPEKEKGRAKGSGNRNACSYGIYQQPDEITDPDKATYLKDRLEHRLGTGDLSGAEIRLMSFVAYLNLQTSLRGKTPPPVGGPISSGVYRILDRLNCWADENKPGGYDLTTNPAGSPVAVAEIEIMINEHEFKVREAFVPGPGDDEVPMIPKVIELSVDALIEEIDDAT